MCSPTPPHQALDSAVGSPDDLSLAASDWVLKLHSNICQEASELDSRVQGTRTPTRQLLGKGYLLPVEESSTHRHDCVPAALLPQVLQSAGLPGH